MILFYEICISHKGFDRLKMKELKKYTAMKKSNFLVILIAFSTVLSGCVNLESEHDKTTILAKRLNICVILDGTDRLCNQAGVPIVSSDEIVEFAKMLANNGVGSFYLSYVDNNCDNNRVAVFEWDMKKPTEIGRKPGHVKVAEYDAMKSANKMEMAAYSEALNNAVELFARDCETICKSAYSDIVAKQKNGSDVTGAINQAIRLLRANQEESDFSSIILVSDGCDNVGKQLDDLQSSKLFIVNSNVSKHQYADIVSKEFVTLRQSFNYIFSKK